MPPHRAEDLTGWPERLPPVLVEQFGDVQMIGFYERQPAEALAAFQSRLVARLTAHALRHSPWWREHLKGVIGRVAALPGLPTMGREQFRESVAVVGKALPLPPDHGPSEQNSTSGSSGVPVAFYVSRFAMRMILHHYEFDNVRQGRDLSRTVAELRAGVPKHEGEHIMARVHPLHEGPLLRRRLPLFPIEQHARWLASTKPSYLTTMPSVLQGLLDAFEEGGFEAPRIDQVLTLGETVTPVLRERAREILGASIRDRYSCEEIGPIAFQCPHDDGFYHVAGTNAVAEILDETGRPCAPGVVGRVFVTGLHNYASPTLRYELGDLAAWRPGCPCGFKGPVLTDLLGRKRFLIRLPSGKRVATVVTATHLLAIAPFRETRLVQVSESLLLAELVLDRPITAGEREAVVAMLREMISPELSYDIRQVEAIDWGSGYKRQDVVSLI